MLIHKGQASTQQWMLVRLEEPAEEAINKFFVHDGSKSSCPMSEECVGVMDW